MTRKPTYADLQKRIDELEDLLEKSEQQTKRDTPSSHSPETDLLNQLRFQKTLFDTIPNPLFYKDRQGVYLGCNKAFSTLILGLPPEKIIGSSLHDLPDRIPTELADIYSRHDQELLENPGLQVYETRVRCADDQIRDYIFYKSTYVDHAGEVAGIVGLMLEVTEKNRIRMKLEESEEKYRSMMESMSDGVYICSEDLSISYMNPKMKEQVGYDATGEKCHEVLHNLEKPCSWCTFNRVRNGEITTAEVTSPRDGRTYIVSNSPIHHRQGSVSKMTIYRDITERVKLEKELLMAKKLEAAGIFAGGIAHDYNNLLFIVLGNLLLLKKELDKHGISSESADNIEQAAQKAASLTKQLLAFTHDESLTLKPIGVETILQKAITAENNEAKYIFDLRHEDTSLQVHVDETLVVKVLHNLFENSKDALDEGGTISITTEQVTVTQDSEQVRGFFLKHPGEYVRISVSDNGSGIDEKIRPLIFDPYFSTKHKSVKKGLGLGLSTSYSIIKKHGGGLRLEPDTETTTFSLYLPVNSPSTIA